MRIKAILNQVKQVVKVEDNIKIVLYPMKYKIASVSLKTRTIRLNKNLVNLFDDKELYYILTHELIHIKLSTLNHGKEFYKILHSIYTHNEIDEIEENIIKKVNKYIKIYNKLL